MNAEPATRSMPASTGDGLRAYPLVSTCSEALAAKAAAVAAEHVTGLISIAPAPGGNLPGDRAPVPDDQPVTFDEDAMRRFFCNAPRFPQKAIDQYRRSLCAMSPGVFNALSSVNGSQDLVIEDLAAFAPISKRVVAATTINSSAAISTAVATSLGAAHITVGKDWGLASFGHMIPIETGSDEILDRPTFG
jgi:hypothetical protein